MYDIQDDDEYFMNNKSVFQSTEYLTTASLDASALSKNSISIAKLLKILLDLLRSNIANQNLIIDNLLQCDPKPPSSNIPIASTGQ